MWSVPLHTALNVTSSAKTFRGIVKHHLTWSLIVEPAYKKYLITIRQRSFGVNKVAVCLHNSGSSFGQRNVSFSLDYLQVLHSRLQRLKRHWWAHEITEVVNTRQCDYMCFCVFMLPWHPRCSSLHPYQWCRTWCTGFFLLPALRSHWNVVWDKWKAE